MAEKLLNAQIFRTEKIGPLTGLHPVESTRTITNGTNHKNYSSVCVLRTPVNLRPSHLSHRDEDEDLALSPPLPLLSLSLSHHLHHQIEDARSPCYSTFA